MGENDTDLKWMAKFPWTESDRMLSNENYLC